VNLLPKVREMDTQSKAAKSSSEDRIQCIQGLVQQERFTQALKEIQELESHPGVDLSPDEQGDISYLASLCLFHLGRCKDALDKAMLAFETFRSSSQNKKVAQIQFILGRISLRLGDSRGAEAHVSDAISTYRRIGDQAEIVNSYNLIAHICFAKCDFDRSIEHLQKAKELCEKVDDIRMAALISGNLGRVHALCGDWSGAEDNLQESLTFNENSRSELGLCKDLLSLGFLSCLRRDFKRSSSLLDRALELARKNDFFRELAIYYEYAGQLACTLGDEKTAVARFYKAIEIGRTACPEGYIRSQTFRLLAELQAAREEFDEALTSCQKSLEASKSLGEKLEEGAAYRILGRIYSGKRDKEKACGYFKQSISLLQQIGARYELATTYLEAGRSDAFDYYRRMGFLANAESLFRDLASRYHLGLVNLAVSDLLTEQKDYASAEVFLAEAERLFKETNDRKELRQVACSRAAIEESLFQSRITAKSNGKVTFDSVITHNDEMMGVIEKLRQIKDYDISILVEGETGAGKDLVAKAVHYSSLRKDKRFVAVNCAALPESLLENELFGHKRGAYTGADKDQPGLFEEAAGGTLYLDQVEEIPVSTQVKLLRAIEEKEITRLGDTKPRKIDVRIICSSIEDLKEAVRKGKFRQDLYFRLNTFSMRIPPLRERKEDIRVLIKHFLKEYGLDEKKIKEFNRRGTGRRFLRYHWPGNVRELENDIKRMVILAQANGKGPWEFLPEKFLRPADDVQNVEHEPLPDQLARFEKERIVEALTETNWNKSRAARILGIPEGTVRSKMKKQGIPAHCPASTTLT